MLSLISQPNGVKATADEDIVAEVPATVETMNTEGAAERLAIRGRTIPRRRAYPINEAASLLGISRTHLYRLRNEGLIQFTKLLGRSVITDAEIERLLQDEGTA